MLSTEHQLAEELQALSRATPDCFATISHELRTPLTSIAGYIEILRDQDAGPLTPAQQKMLETVDRNAAKLWQLIENVLTLSKIEADTFRTTRDPVDLAGLVSEAAVTEQPRAVAGGLSLTGDCPPDGLVVEGDTGQLRHLLTTLLDHIMNLTPPGGTIRVSVAPAHEMAVLSVTGSGTNVPVRVARPAPAGDDAATLDQEHDPELGMCRAIVANHQGEMELAIPEERRVAITVRIPLAETSH